MRHGTIRRVVIVGPAGSGKTTLAESMLEPGTVVVDFDALAYAAGSRVDHHAEPHHPNHVLVAAELRKRLLGVILEGIRLPDVVVIHATPEQWHLADYARRGFQLIEPEGVHDDQ